MEYLRSYEISIWTLQDSFITVLKPANLEYKGQIIDPVLTLKDDGENKLSFKIPMYMQNDFGDFEENPLWYTTKDGTIIADLRKIKVIFNKTTADEAIYEFVILNVEESHEGKKKYCKIDGEGLAFHELGRQGYKIALEGMNEITEKLKDWEKEGGEKPAPTINYWANRVFENSNWRYSIQMDWSQHDGITHQIYNNLDSDNYVNFTEEQKDIFNDWRSRNGLRRRDRIYRDKFVSSWALSEDEEELIATTVQSEEEKQELVEAKNSNRYNLSQTIAERFQVFCKYKYYYDDNYHIIDREAIFYNNFLNESQGFIDLTYKYNTEHLTRKMDGFDLVTKMFVSTLKDNDMPSGEISIGDSLAHKSGEDYLLNFDYLKNVGTITQEQYDAIEPYEAKLRDYNLKIDEYNNNIFIKKERKTKLEAEKKDSEDKRKFATERKNNTNSLIRSLTQEEENKEGITIDSTNPMSLYLIPTEGNKNICYCNINIKGVKPETLLLYWDYDSASHSLTNLVNNFKKEFDDDGNLVKVSNIARKNSNSDKVTVYATFTYRPRTYYDNIIEVCNTMIAQSDIIINNAEAELTNIEASINIYENKLKQILKNKQNHINKFERLMGPALREGTWKPEDEYAKYGERHEDIVTLTNTSIETNDLASFIWDSELEDKEQDLFFKYGITLNNYCYPCIKITNHVLNNFGINNFFTTKLNFIFDVNDLGLPSSKEYMTMNSNVIIGFIKNKNDNSITPVLMLLDVARFLENEDEDRLLRMKNSGRLAITNVDINNEEIIEESIIEIKNNNLWLISPTDIKNSNNYEAVFPRIKINSNRVKSPNLEIELFYGSNFANKLKNYDDYYILSRRDCWLVTLKSHSIFNPSYFYTEQKDFKIKYIISTAATAIYLDAIEVLKENSYPKVSYDIDIISVNKDFIYNAYNRLGQIAHINDYEFKFNNVMGYISELNLDLDKPWKDKVVIKNYKTKFEDLFSKIVAQTENLKNNSSVIGLVTNAFQSDGYLTESLLANALERLANEINPSSTAIPPETEYLKYEPYIRSLLRQVYIEAGQVLSAAQKSVTDVYNLNLINSDILGSYRENIKENLTPTLFRDNNLKQRYNTTLGQIDVNFKVGDIWQRDNYSYMATENSHQVTYNYQDDKYTSLKGWSLIQDGTLAQIKGTSLDINSQSGDISILAQNNINIKSGGTLNLASGNVQILGNQKVGISGPDIYIYSGITNSTTNHGIHIYATAINSTDFEGNRITGTSAIDITGSGIVMKAAEGIKMCSGTGIDFVVSDSDNTSVISINKNKGIWLGTNNEIVFYSGQSYDGASVRINQNEILFGVTSGASGNAINITNEHIIFGSSFVTNGITNIGGIGETVAGVDITKDYIKMAVGSENYRGLFSLTGYEMTLGIANKNNDGAIVKLHGKDGIIIGTAGKKQDIINDMGKGQITYEGARFQVYCPNFVVDESGHLYAYNADISGTIYANAGKIAGWLIDDDGIRNADWGSRDEGAIAFSTSNFTRVLHDDTLQESVSNLRLAIGKYFGVDAEGILYADNFHLAGKGDIKIASQGSISMESGAVFTIKSGSSISIEANSTFIVNSPNFSIDAAGSVYMAGTINATSGYIANWIIEGNYIKAGSGQNYFCLDSGDSNSGTTHRMWFGNEEWDKAPFQVKTDGSVILSGATINGKTKIDTDGENFSVKNGEFFSMKAITEIVEGENSGRLTFKVRGKLNNTLYGNSIEVTPGNTSFSRMAIFSGGAYFPKGFQTVQGNTIYSLTSADNSRLYNIVVSTNSPVFHSDCDRILWIEPHGSWDLTNPDFATLSCRVHWCARYGTY